MIPQWHQIESPLPVQDCADRLRKAVDPLNLFDLPAAGTKPVYGFVEEGWFELWQRGPRSERGVNAVQGSLVPSGSATIVRYRCTWDDGLRWAGWFSVIAAVMFSVGTLALIVYAYLGPRPGPQPYAWLIAILPVVVAPAAILGYWRAARLARQQQEFLVEFLERTVKGIPLAK